MKGFFLTALTFVIYSASAQNCGDLEEWSKMLRDEFSDADLSNLRSGSALSNRILYNLYSDKYFIPFGGEPYDKMGEGEREARWKRVRMCNQRKKYAGDPYMNWIHWIGMGPLSIKHLGPETARKVAELRNLRAEYNATLQQIQSGEMSFEKFAGIKRLTITKFQPLLPSEIKYFAGVAAAAETGIANKDIIAQAQTAVQAGSSYNSIIELQAFRQRKSALYAAADNSSKEKANALIDSKIKIILEALVAEEIQDIGHIAANEEGVAKINRKQRDFNQRYTPFTDFAEVGNANRQISARKTEIVNRMSGDIRSRILNATEVESIRQIEVMYLSNVDKNSTPLNELGTLAETRMSQITAEQQRIETARLDQQRKLSEDVRKTEQQRDAIIRQRIAVADKSRQALNQKYANYFPSLGDLFEIVGLVPTIADRAYDSDQQRFIGALRKLGYNLVKGQIYSDVNDFKNAFGSTIGTLRSVKPDKLYAVICEFPNAPRDVVEHYALEIISEYRERAESMFNFQDDKIQTVKKSPSYVKSGSTLYSYEMKHDTLKISVIWNFDGKAPVMTERLNENSLKVSPYSNITDFTVKQGDKLSFYASGSMKLGTFAGTSGPDGINGYEIYSATSNLRHGSLIGKIGEDGAWFSIGSRKAIIAERAGRLYLRVNDRDLQNNDGYYIVSYVLEDRENKSR